MSSSAACVLASLGDGLCSEMGRPFIWWWRGTIKLWSTHSPLLVQNKESTPSAHTEERGYPSLPEFNKSPWWPGCASQSRAGTWVLPSPLSPPPKLPRQPGQVSLEGLWPQSLTSAPILVSARLTYWLCEFGPVPIPASDSSPVNEADDSMISGLL